MGNGASKAKRGPTPQIKIDTLAAKPANAISSTVTFVHTEDLNDRDSEKLAKNSWDQILRNYNQSQNNCDNASIGNNVKVFVSSTFTDFFYEREALVKRVFPELRDWCQERGLGLQEVDLRWGVPKDSTTSDTISLCMQELETCSRITNQKPFFIGLIGARYGWVPEEADVPEELRNAWIPNLSITNMEIVSGTLGQYNPHACFFFRNSEFLHLIPQTSKSRFTDTGFYAKVQLKELQTRLFTLYPKSSFEYNVELEGIDNDTNQPKIGGLDEFSNQVLKFMKNAISTSTSLAQGENTWFFQNIPYERSFVGRKGEIKTILEYCLQKEDNAGKYFVIQGPRRCGKTSLMAQTANQLKAYSDVNVFYHFPSSSADSNQISVLLRRLIHFARPSQKTEGIYLDNLMTSAHEILQNYNAIFLFDAIDQLDHASSASHLNWLPNTVSSKTRIVVSMSDHLPTESRINDRPHEHTLTVTQLTINEQQTYCKEYFLGFGKHMPVAQINDVIGEGRDLGWLRLALDELRLLGHYKKVDSSIKALPPQYSSLAIHILNRIIEEDGDGKTRQVLVLLCCESDMLEEEVKAIVSDQKEASLPALSWARILRSLRPFITLTNGKISIHDTELKQVIKDKLIENEAQKVEAHCKLSTFYDRSHDWRRVASKLAYHLHASKQIKKLVAFLLRDKRSNFMQPFDKQKWIQDLRCGQMVLDTGRSSGSCCFVCIWCPHMPNTCCLCGNLGVQSQAYLCHKHHTVPPKCIKCAKPVPNQKVEAKTAYICSRCKGFTNLCAFIQM